MLSPSERTDLHNRAIAARSTARDDVRIIQCDHALCPFGAHSARLDIMVLQARMRTIPFPSKKEYPALYQLFHDLDCALDKIQTLIGLADRAIHRQSAFVVMDAEAARAYLKARETRSFLFEEKRA